MIARVDIQSNSFELRLIRFPFILLLFKPKQDVLGSNLICVARSFAFGVLFAVCFLHLIPENARLFEELGKSKNHLGQSLGQSYQHKLPWSEIITCCGFLFIYMLDLTMHWLVMLFNKKRNPCITTDVLSFDTHSEENSSDKYGQRSLIHATDNAKTDTVQFGKPNNENAMIPVLLEENIRPGLASNTESKALTQASFVDQNGKEAEHKNRRNHFHHLDYHISKPVQDQMRMTINLHRCDFAGKKSRLLAEHECGKKSILLANGKENLLESPPKSVQKIKKTFQRPDYGTVSEMSKTDKEMSLQENLNTPRQPRLLSLFNSIMIIGGLSMHAVFEGFAIGVQQDPFVLYQLVGAVCIHKLLIALVLGLNLLCETTSMRDSIVGLAVFSSMTPIGLLIGALWLRHLSDDNNSVCLPVANALATGTMIYVTFFETRPQVDHHSNFQSVLHLLTAVCGFFGILAALLITS